MRIYSDDLSFYSTGSIIDSLIIVFDLSIYRSIFKNLIKLFILIVSNTSSLLFARFCYAILLSRFLEFLLSYFLSSI